MDIFPQQIQELQTLGNIDAYTRQRRLLLPILYMTERGILMDPTQLRDLAGEAEERLVILQKQFTDIVGYEINPASNKQVCEYFYDIKGHRTYKSRKTGNPTVDNNALKRLAKSKDPEVSQAAIILAEIRGLSRLDSTYFTVSLDSDNRLRCTLNPAGTESGRLSSSKTIFGTGMNMQNQPPGMKECMYVDKDYVGFSVDLAQAENRVVAYYAPDLLMIEAFEEGIDLHAQTASIIFDVPISEVTYDERNPDHWVPIGSGNHAMRYWGKKANHALNYGMGPGLASLLWECSMSEAKFIINKYLSAYPGVIKFHAKIKNTIKTNKGIVTTPLGRSRIFLGFWGEELWKSAYSFIPQSTVAHKLNRDGIEYIYYNQDLFPHVELLMQIHDSIEFQIPLSVGWHTIAETLLLIKASLESPIKIDNRSFSIPADIKLLPFNLGIGTEFKASALPPSTTPATFAEQLQAAYNEHTTTEQPHVREARVAEAESSRLDFDVPRLYKRD